MRATLRWAHADLRAHRGQSLFVVLASAGIIASLLLAVALFSYAANPWQRIFSQSQGAHVWLHTRSAADTAALSELDGIAGVSGPFRTGQVTLESRGARASVSLRAADTRPPEIARPLVTAGDWLDQQPGGVVLESSLARVLWAEPGDTLTVAGPDGTARTLFVAGVAEAAEPRYRPGGEPGIGWVLPRTLNRVAAGSTGQSVGLRLTDPADLDFTIQQAVTQLGADRVARVTKWQQARAEAGSDDRLLGQLFAVFGLGALLAAALAASGAISARIRGQLRDISILKAIGFTPGQVVRGFLAQHLAFALLGVTLGSAAIALLGARIPGRIGEAAGVWQDLPGHTALMIGVPSGAVLLIATATGLAAWRAGRVPPVPVARAALPLASRMTGLGRRALGMRVPPALVLGWRAAFPRRPRTLITVARLALPLLMITVALVAWSTLDMFRSRPADMGVPAALSVRAEQPGSLSGRDLERALAAPPDVSAVHPGVEVAALVPGQTGTITLRGLGTADAPYPFTVVEGRPADGPDEAVAGQGLLDLLDVRVGDWVRMTVEGRPQILHIVGRSIEPEAGGRVISTTVDTLQERDPAVRPDFYHLVLRPGADPRAVSSELAHEAGGALEIRETTNPGDRLEPARGVIAALIGVLALIGLTELLTLIGTSVRDRGRDLLALKAIGLTPRQISSAIVAAAGFTALLAAAIGTGLGVLSGSWLVDTQGRSSGMGAGIAHVPPTLLLASVVVGAVLGAVAAAALPAARTARRRLADSLAETL
ncbi:putative ABC transport system permease protein [Streptomyces sp. SLBN-118]|uniref:FtsX-like permease family protein n=1 Tax=Streptomyces sp. SLBN-118 TaxID=2768454 RepID=UPI00114E8548|nr:FtsX-like permease family protein [Streptomyces sp. SLBN-118]TQK42814.1 putative ABC transport system permease protein [Streptomyces sp. SLBN-118]